MMTMIYWHPILAATVLRVLGSLPALHLVGWLADPPIPHPLFPLAIAAAGAEAMPPPSLSFSKTSTTTASNPWPMPSLSSSSRGARSA
ncbi:hypothetical protein [Ktedonobacter sp. SOSP1-52]|uniref:hypothetical protein n=1 Tax=Ktedonobacter sp. SOSP1-52 TaxID=2778366 RepID=UPI001F48C887|nr:hypothetical protein [Ktedonobacter sp. SOSP1-52]